MGRKTAWASHSHRQALHSTEGFSRQGLSAGRATASTVHTPDNNSWGTMEAVAAGRGHGPWPRALARCLPPPGDATTFTRPCLRNSAASAVGNLETRLSVPDLPEH